MNKSKDLFSGHASMYEKYRPTYPQDLYAFLLTHLNTFDVAWDCATGNGQVAYEIARFFKKVYATDISEKQLSHAQEKDNIIYSIGAAESFSVPNTKFDLITVGQAYHWFDFDAFNNHIYSVLNPNGIIAIWGYRLLTIHDEVDELIFDFYSNTLNGYWEPERNYVDDSYRNLPFPYNELKCPEFFIHKIWNIDLLKGYLETWSAVRKFIAQNQFNPVVDLVKKIEKTKLLNDPFAITIPVFVRVGKLKI
jgi:SAM-dependent methyltransferase